MNYWIDIEDSNGNKFGAGALTTVMDWESTSSMDEVGKFSFSIPASDPRSSIIQPKRIVRCYTRVLQSIEEIGSGVIDKITPVTDEFSNTILKVEGSDLLRELTYRSVGFLELKDSEGNGVTNPISQIMGFAPSGWSIDTSVGTGEPASNVYASFAGETVLNALKKVAESKGEHFRLQKGRKIAWLGKNLQSSNIRAVQGGNPIDIEGNDNVCIVQELQEEQDTYNVCTRLYPFGSGIGDARLTLASTTRTVPAGFILDKVNNCIINTKAEATYGRIDNYISFKEIAPISNTDLDLENASNSLFDQSLVYLLRHSEAEKFYKIKVLKLNKLLNVGEKIRVVFNENVDGYPAFSIDEELYILETTNLINNSGIRTSEISVATIDRFPEDESTLLLSQLTTASVFESHPQLNANAYVVPYRESMDNSKPAQIDFWLGNEVLNVNQVSLKFKIDPLRSTVKSVAGNSTTSSSGGGGGGTSSSGGGSTTTSAGSLGSHYHSITAPFYVNYTYYTDSSNQYHTHQVSVPNHSHTFSMGTHSHSVTPSISTVYGLYEESTSNTLVEADLIYKVNHGDPMGRAVSIGDGWYELDVTSLVSNPQSFRPLQVKNLISISTNTAKTALITAQLVVRTVIQAIAVY